MVAYNREPVAEPDFFYLLGHTSRRENFMTLRKKLEYLAYKNDPPIIAAEFALRRLNELGWDDYPELGFDPELMKRLSFLEKVPN